MRVALVHSFYSSAQPSGENVVVEQQAVALREAGHEVLLVSIHTDNRQSQRLYGVRTGAVVATGYGPDPRRQLTDFRPDIVHVHNLFPNWGSRWLDRWPGPIVVTLHNFRTLCAKGTLFRDGSECFQCPDESSTASILHACYRGSRVASIPLAVSTRNRGASNPLLTRPEMIIALSERAVQMFSRGGAPTTRMKVIPNFVADTGFSPEAGPGSAWLYAGRLTEEKGVDRLLANWPTNVPLEIVGTGPLEPQLRRRAGHNISFLGQVERKEVPRILSNARGLVFPSLWAENSPMSYIEALAAGRPVLALKGNAVADDVSNGGHGVVFHDWDSLDTSMQHAESHWLEFSRASRTRFEAEFSQTAWTRRTTQLYTQAMARNHAARDGQLEC